MDLLQDKSQQQLPHQACTCEICMYRPKNVYKVIPSDLKTPNSLHTLLKLLPPSFPILIEQTIALEYKQPQLYQYHFYSNFLKDEKRKWIVNHQIVRSLHAISSQNVALYYKNRQKIMARFQAVTFLANNPPGSNAQELLYVQPYQPRPIIRTSFQNQRGPLKDELLIQHLRKEEDRVKSNTYRPNQQFFQWVFTEYGQTTFCNFITQLYVRIFKLATNHSIINAIFYWVLEPLKSDIQGSKSGARAQYQQMQLMGRPRKLTFKPKLVNIRNLQVQFYEKLYSFQDQYSELIKKRIYSTSKKTITAVKNKAYRSRLDNFREKLQGVYHQEQALVLSKVQQEKAFQFQQDSEKMVRLLVPNLPKNQTLRQVLSDQRAFRLLIIKPSHKRVRTQNSKTNFSQVNPWNPQKGLIKNNSLKTELRHVQSVHKRYQKLLKTPSTMEKQ